MGGNALKNCDTRRHQYDEYKNKSADILSILRVNGGYRAESPPSYSAKDSFGDLDILVQGLLPPDHFLRKYFNTKEIVRNGAVLSFEYDELQVDLTSVPADTFDYAYAYFSYNDLHNFVGRITNRFGLKHGHQGLLVPVMDENGMVLDEVVLTKDPRQTLDYFGFDLPQYDRGFDTLEDMFEWIEKSPGFNPHIYLWESVNAKSRIRDRKRPNYNKFLDWIEEKSLLGRYANILVDKEVSRERAIKFFHVEDQVNAILEKDRRKKFLATKFNGNLVKELTELEGQLLGNFMKEHKETFNEEFLENNTTEEVSEMVLKLYKGMTNV